MRQKILHSSGASPWRKSLGCGAVRHGDGWECGLGRIAWTDGLNELAPALQIRVSAMDVCELCRVQTTGNQLRANTLGYIGPSLQW